MSPINSMKDLEWQGNSRKMYQAILNQVPSFFAGSVRSSIFNWIVKNNIRVVTEELVFKAVREIAPPSLAGSIEPQLEKLRSK